MTRDLQFIWIDDLPSRESVATNLGEALDVKVDFINLKGEDLEDKIEKMVSGDEPSLIIIDHKLQDTSNGLFKTGSTAASMIRETWPECPIICVSGVEMEDFNLAQKEIYEAIFPDASISNHYKTIYSIAISYRIFRQNRPQNIEDLTELMGVLNEDADRLKSIIPAEIKDNLSDKGVIKHVSNWIRNVLFERPGFLYDSLWAATFIGVNNKGFEKIAPFFADAQYTGIFADESKPRWWKMKLLSILSENVEQVGLPWEKGRSLPGLSEEDYSACYVTNESFPETVAFTDDTHNERHPMKLKETIQDDSFQELLYFEELRKMSPAQ